MALSKPNQELIAIAHLERQGYEPYCPRFKETKPGKAAVIRPLFPRYLFIGIDQVWYSIRGTRGISHVLLGRDGPQYISGSIIKELRNREIGGLVSLVPKERFARGTKVKATDGPLMGLELIYEGMSTRDRCVVLMDMLGRQVKIDVEERALTTA